MYARVRVILYIFYFPVPLLLVLSLSSVHYELDFIFVGMDFLTFAIFQISTWQFMHFMCGVDVKCYHPCHHLVDYAIYYIGIPTCDIT